MGNKIQRIYVGDHYEVYPQYKVNANTVAYYPFKSDLKDYSGNGYDFTTYSGTTSFVDGMVQTNGKLSRNSLMSALGSNFTMAMYISHVSGEQYLWHSSDRQYSTFNFGSSTNSLYFKLWNNGNWYGAGNSSIPYDGKIHFIAGVKNGTSYKLYIDGELKNSSTVSYSIKSETYFMLGNVVNYTTTAKFGNLILEKVARTDQQIKDLYDQTKATYQGFN